MYYHLNCNSTTQVTIAYDLLGSAPRSDNTSRINPAYTAFLAFGFGDDVTVQVIVPTGFISETFGGDVVQTRSGGNTIYTAAHIPNPNEFQFLVSASNNAALIESEITTENGVEFVLRTWPGDDEWQDFMTEQIETGVPVLVELIGQPWPIDEPVDVRESYTPYLYGYAGWFSAGSNEIEIGEDLDADTALHELSHAWFNDAWFSDRWLSEGFAQLYASRGIDELGGDGLEPLPIRSNDAGKVLLNEWGDPFFNPDEDIDDVETFGYNASFYVVKQIAEEIGDDQLREVLDAVANDKTAYRGDLPPEKSVTVSDWRRFLDLVEEVGARPRQPNSSRNTWSPPTSRRCLPNERPPASNITSWSTTVPSGRHQRLCALAWAHGTSRERPNSSRRPPKCLPCAINSTPRLRNSGRRIRPPSRTSTSQPTTISTSRRLQFWNRLKPPMHC